MDRLNGKRQDRRRRRRRHLLIVSLVLTLASPGPSLFSQEAELLISPGKLSKAHEEFSGLNSCGKCHTAGTKSVDAKCLACHAELGKRIEAGRSFHRDKKTGCPTCHPDHQGTDFPLVDWKPKEFDHSKSGYPLVGKHAGVTDCQKCHNARTSVPTKLAPSYLLKSDRCASCHEDAHRAQFKQDCSTCHPVEAPFKENHYDHEKAAYRLKGAHRSVSCEKCHPEQKWTGLKSAACADCHRDKHAPSFGTTCEKCHTEVAWKSGTSNHDKSRFPLKGKHASLKCEQCHKNGRLDKIPGSSCRYCHTNDPHRGQFKDDCGSCHTEAGFKPAKLDHQVTRYPLTGKHANVACAKCHAAAEGSKVIRYQPLPTKCVDCHRDIHLGQFKKDCESCHSTQGFGRDVSAFDHDRDSSYRLEGAHAGTKCEACHKKQTSGFPAGAGEAVRYRPIASDCLSCHADEHAGQLGPDCAKCHDLAHFKPAPKFSHEKTSYSLKGLHEGVACEKCHPRADVTVSGQARQTSKYKPLEQKCDLCHRRFDHAKTDFALTGRHTQADCAGCHTSQNPNVKRLRVAQAGISPPRDCQPCHADPHGGVLKETCASCHETSGWATTARGFHKTTDFPLVGRHLTVPCESCHLDGVVKGTPKGCYDCHWIRREDDPYRTRLGAQCEECHKPTSWNAVQWDHGAKTGLPLNAAHRTVGCDGCHKNQTFQGTSSDCYDCHRENYTETKNPGHALAGFPTTCQICHRPSDTTWQQGTFNHGTVFPLQGTHATVPCSSCHANNMYKGTSRDCYGCHRTNYDQTNNPRHVSSGFPTTCDTCHKATDQTWTQGTFNHATAYPLQGYHATLTCASCHGNNVYKGTSRDCYGCHRTNYDQTNNPKHVATGFPTTCDTCHKITDTSWTQGTFNHATVYQLQGYHATLACASCHGNNVYKGTPRDCYGCHRANYDQTNNPKHVSSGFPTTCDTCHRITDTAWTQASFNHSTVYALQGYHATLACAACHVNNVYHGTPRDCYSCHRTLYTQTTNPNHAAAGFPTTCDSCHRITDTSWTQGTFNHTWFPISSGRHSGYNCSDCHTTPSNYQAFTCLTCHARSSVDSHHRSVSGYVYNSPNCYSCHPRGSAG